ncbi:hypothetical protein XBI1_2470019 [Xenorhabdus bovienii str. Intermedium]|uniref:Uncharacterized protein n=1 Tax=Xenorhabdus bovienii str. Intermedium TaxID=1379677 RepID=A0A077QAK1_XENBV|nr:hypothetical protein XBI1_2470019 [Xenorhabdus bovienii str. Intermedium]
MAFFMTQITFHYILDLTFTFSDPQQPGQYSLSDHISPSG